MKQTWINCTKKQAIIIPRHEAKIGYVEHFPAIFSGLALLVFRKCSHKQLFSSISNQFCRSCSLLSIKAAQTGFGVVLILIKLEMMTTPHWFTNGHLIVSLLLFANVYNRISYIAWVPVLHIKQISTSDSPQRKKKKKKDLWSRFFHITLLKQRKINILYISSISSSEQD